MFEFLFGKKRRKCNPKRYNVKGSPCNKLKRGDCRSKTGCTYVKRRGCRRSKNHAKMMALLNASPSVNAQIDAVAQKAVEEAKDKGLDTQEQILMGAAAAADAAIANATSVLPKQRWKDAGKFALNMAKQEAVRLAMEKGMEERQAREILDMVGQKLKTVDFQKSINTAKDLIKQNKYPVGGYYRSTGFGSECTQIVPRDASTCMNYRNANGLYPCTWAKPNTCKARAGGAVPYEVAAKTGMYQSYVIATTPGFQSVKPVSVPAPVAPVSVKNNLEDIDEAEDVPVINTDGSVKMDNRGNVVYECASRGEGECGSNPNCRWFPKGNRCVRQIGHLSGVQYSGPLGTSGFGRRTRKAKSTRKVKSRKVRKGKSSRKVKPPKALLRKCKKYHIKTTKKVGGRRVYRPTTVLKKLLRKKMKKMKKNHKVRRSRR